MIRSVGNLLCYSGRTMQSSTILRQICGLCSLLLPHSFKGYHLQVFGYIFRWTFWWQQNRLCDYWHKTLSAAVILTLCLPWQVVIWLKAFVSYCNSASISCKIAPPSKLSLLSFFSSWEWDWKDCHRSDLGEYLGGAPLWWNTAPSVLMSDPLTSELE